MKFDWKLKCYILYLLGSLFPCKTSLKFFADVMFTLPQESHSLMTATRSQLNSGDGNYLNRSARTMLTKSVCPCGACSAEGSAAFETFDGGLERTASKSREIPSDL